MSFSTLLMPLGLYEPFVAGIGHLDFGVLIPAGIGAAVTVIGDGAFSHNTKVTSVVLPDVTVLGDYAFGSCKNLETVTLGQLKKIGEYAFFETAITELR